MNEAMNEATRRTIHDWRNDVRMTMDALQNRRDPDAALELLDRLEREMIIVCERAQILR